MLGLALVLAFGLSYEFFVFVGVTVDVWYAIWILPTIALLLVFAAAVQAILSWRNAPEETPPGLPVKADHTLARYLMLSSALALVRGYDSVLCQGAKAFFTLRSEGSSTGKWRSRTVDMSLSSIQSRPAWV